MGPPPLGGSPGNKRGAGWDHPFPSSGVSGARARRLRCGLLGVCFGKLLPWLRGLRVRLPRVAHPAGKVGHSCFLLWGWDAEEVGEDVTAAARCSCVHSRLYLASCVSARQKVKGFYGCDGLLLLLWPLGMCLDVWGWQPSAAERSLCLGFLWRRGTRWSFQVESV